MTTPTHTVVCSVGSQRSRILPTINPQGIDWSVYLAFAREPEDVLYEASLNRQHIEPVGHGAKLRYFTLKPFAPKDPDDEREVPFDQLVAKDSDFRDMEPCITFDDDCECRDGHVCIKCCTRFDIEILPPDLEYEVGNKRFGIRGQEVFDLFIDVETAQLFGIV